MSKLTHRLAALCVSAAVVFTIGSARSEDLPAVDFETRSLAVECLENGGFEDTTIKNNPGKGFWDANNSASAQYAVVAGWGTGFRVGNGGNYSAPSGFKVGT